MEDWWNLSLDNVVVEEELGDGYVEMILAIY